VNEFPKEYFVPLSNNENLLGRIIITKIHEKYCSEIDIVQVESKKIFHHVIQLFNFPDEQEALDQSVQRLAQFLKKFLQ
jgi:hypothetical protein